jgi:hypothetical protein
MSVISNFFASLGINPFLAGFVIGAVLCAFVRVGFAAKSAPNQDFTPQPTRPTVAAPPVSNEVPPAVLDSIRRGNTIEAIKILKESSGIGLAEAKSVVEAIIDSQGAR